MKQINTSNNKFRNKKIYNNFFQIVTIFFTCLLFIIFLSVLGFLVYKSIDAFSSYGISNILFTSDFKFSSSGSIAADQGVSFWVPFSITLLTTTIAILIAAPVGIKCATFIKFRINNKYKKIFRISFETLAGIPSVIFGLFAVQSLGFITRYIFNLSTVYTIINASIMLSFMILPTIISITLNTLDNANVNLLTNPIALGTTKTKAIYKIYKKSVKSSITVGVILAVGRSIGEAMATSMILASSSYSNINGLGETFASNLLTISSFISHYMFADSLGVNQESLLFAFGLILFIVIGLINLIILFISKNKNYSNNKNSKFYFIKVPFIFCKNVIRNLFSIIINFFNIVLEKIFFRNKFNKKSINSINNKKISEVIEYSKHREENYKFKNIYSFYKIFWEVFSVLICFGFLSWLLLDILIQGGLSLSSSYQSIFSYSRDTTGQAFFNTILIVIVSLTISLPLALFISIYISEYLKNKKANSFITFFIDAFGSTPSILYGIFGLVVFIQIFGLTASGSTGNSLFAGALTISIVILPNLIRSISLALKQIPIEAKMNALALGSSKFDYIRKILLPFALTGIFTSIILSVGRIFAESAPLYLTSGLTSSAYSTLSLPGQTLTTRIYAQLFNSSVTIQESLSIMYESSFLLILLIFSLIFIAYIVLPNQRRIKKYAKDKFSFLYFYFKNKLLLLKS